MYNFLSNIFASASCCKNATILCGVDVGSWIYIIICVTDSEKMIDFYLPVYMLFHGSTII